MPSTTVREVPEKNNKKRKLNEVSNKNNVAASAEGNISFEKAVIPKGKHQSGTEEKGIKKAKLDRTRDEEFGDDGK